jgi:HK97 family phage prohead protease
MTLIEKRQYSALKFDGRTVEGYASVFGVIDSDGDVILKGAFKKTLLERGHRVKALLQHQHDKPLGPVLEMYEDDHGLYVKFVISETSYGSDMLVLLKDYLAANEHNELFPMSIMIELVQAGRAKAANGKMVREIKEVKLFEFSLVTFPANEEAAAFALKQHVPDTLMEEATESVLEAHPLITKELHEDGSVIVRMGDYLQGSIHEVFTLMADRWLKQGLLSVEQRIQLSSLIGDALGILAAGMPQEVSSLPIEIIPDWLSYIGGSQLRAEVAAEPSMYSDAPVVSEGEDAAAIEEKRGRAGPDEDPPTHQPDLEALRERFKRLGSLE